MYRRRCRPLYCYKNCRKRELIMKCPSCRKNMKKVKDVIKQDGVDFEAYLCPCGEEILDMKQLKVLADKYRKLRDAKSITFSKWGNSIGIRIPGDVVQEYNIAPGKKGTLSKDDDGIRILVCDE